MTKKCPKCDGERFYVTAHITQEWRVDRYGEYLDTINQCVDVTHWPSSEDIWECAKCGFREEGYRFDYDDNTKLFAEA